MALLALLVVIYGTAGYMIVEGWSFLDGLYMTLITLTTVGFTEVHPMDDAGRIFTMSLLVMGVGLIAVTLSLAAQLIQEGALGDRGRRRRMGKRIEDLRSHYIVCAYGRVGTTVARQLESEGVPFVVIDRLESIEEQMAQDGVTYLIGNPSDESVLLAAGVVRARGLVCAVDDDADSVFVTLAARAINPDIYIVARASTENAARALYNAGANRVISPYVNSGRDMAHQVLHRRVVDAIDITIEGAAPMLIEELQVEPGSSLIDAELGPAIGRATALAVRRTDGEVITNPQADLVLHQGDLLVLLGDRESLRPLEGD
jgi:voltage-gated potassium channel